MLTSIKKIINNSDADIFVVFGDKEKLFIDCDSGIAEFVMPYITEKTIVFPEIISLKYKKLSYYLTLKQINSIQINGMGDVIFEEPLKTKKLSILLNGSGDLIADNIEILNLNSKINGSGDINVDGVVNDCDIFISGSGNFYGIDLNAEYVKIKTMGSGDVFINAIENFKALLEGSGDIYLKDNPKNYHSIRKGSGDVKEIK